MKKAIKKKAIKKKATKKKATKAKTVKKKLTFDEEDFEGFDWTGEYYKSYEKKGIEVPGSGWFRAKCVYTWHYGASPFNETMSDPWDVWADIQNLAMTHFKNYFPDFHDSSYGPIDYAFNAVNGSLNSSSLNFDIEVFTKEVKDFLVACLHNSSYLSEDAKGIIASLQAQNPEGILPFFRCCYHQWKLMLWVPMTEAQIITKKNQIAKKVKKQLAKEKKEAAKEIEQLNKLYSKYMGDTLPLSVD